VITEAVFHLTISVESIFKTIKSLIASIWKYG